MLILDGSFGEGGGQILRTALSLAAIYKKPFAIKNIRSNRLNPGLQPQHLAACFAARKVCRGELAYASLGSKYLEFQPGEIVGGDYTFDIQTAGSSILVAQTLIPILLHASKKSHFSIHGGTHLPKSPNVDYFENVFLEALRQFGVHISASCRRPGYYPKGGGELEIKVEPTTQINGQTEWKKETLKKGIISLSNLPKHIALREKGILREGGIDDVRIRETITLSPGNAVTLFQGFLGASILAIKGKRAEIVAQEALIEFNKEKHDVDQHLADQLLLYAVQARGKTRYLTTFATPHLETNIFVISQFIDRQIHLYKHDGFAEIEII